MLDKFCRRSRRKRSDVVRDALRRQLSLMMFEQLRHKAMPFAEARGFLTDEDISKTVSSRCLDTNALVGGLATRGLCADLIRFVLAEYELIIGQVAVKELKEFFIGRLSYLRISAKSFSPS